MALADVLAGLQAKTGEELHVSDWMTVTQELVDQFANATGDRLFIVNAETLELIDAEILGNLEETHDAIFTPDDKYVVITSRTKRPDDDCENPQDPKPDEFLMDGHLKLYDVSAKKIIGKSSSVCLGCHDGFELDKHAVLCGLDANWKN